MIFKKNEHNYLYNTLLNLSRNIFFYKEINLPDTFETRIYLMFLHFSIMMNIFKKKNKKFDQSSYDNLFFNIENNLRELGFGDVSVNKKMKELNQILYDILLKMEKENSNKFTLNNALIIKYFASLGGEKNSKYVDFETYFSSFYDFCFGLDLDNMVQGSVNFKFIYGSP